MIQGQNLLSERVSFKLLKPVKSADARIKQDSHDKNHPAFLQFPSIVATYLLKHSIYVGTLFHNDDIMAQNISSRFKNLMRSRLIRTGVPFVVFVVGGSYFLKQFASLRYDFRQGKRLSKEEAENMGLKQVDVKVVTEEIFKDIEKGDLDTWQNIRGPRPWEDSKTFQVAERQKIRQAESEQNS
ncbi:hypothetical protein RRG08_026681 [Elysia crispata]|uniref:Cytochrome c oxidase assembly protein COX16 homolog, mitochondrial n=1 Tax=Elysia crispata TaxID=231223 RepID=A0AAE1E6U9_9GAST|nr:hypothetical protein RRG08_026681 [Elysia crispata]